MKKIITLLSLASALLLVSACNNMEKPSPLDTQSANSLGLGGADIPGDATGDSDPGLASRGQGSLGFDPENIPPEMIACTIYFGFDQYAIPAAERPKLQAAAETLKGDASARIVLVGHTDWYGTEEYNLLLSDKRGNAVLEYLSSLGVAASSMEVVGRGETGSSPDVAKDSPQAQHDRRVDVVKAK